MSQTRKPRDTGRANVYGAEQDVRRILDRAAAGANTFDFHGSILTLPVERKFADVPSMQRYCDLVLALDWVTSRYPNLPGVTVRERAGEKKAHWQTGNVIAVPVTAGWAMRELVLLHEIAHHLSQHDPRATAEPWHGPTFTATFVALVNVAIGPEAGLLLRAGFDDNHVPVGTTPEMAS